MQQLKIELNYQNIHLIKEEQMFSFLFFLVNYLETFFSVFL